MVRINCRMMLWCAAVAGAVGCSSAEKQASVPVAKPPVGRVSDPEETTQQGPALKQPAEVATETQPPAEKVATVHTERQAEVDGTPKETILDPQVKPAAAAEPVKEGAPQPRTAFFRLDANAPAIMPKVMLSKSHEALCKVNVGDALPAIELPVVGANQRKKLSDLYSKSATVVLFWKGDRRMTREALADLGPDVTELFGDRGVAVVGIAVNETAVSAKAALDKTGAKFVNLLDADGKAFAQVGTGRLPRVFLVDPTGKILWFDIEYSQTTRRELHQALRAVTGEPASAGGKRE